MGQAEKTERGDGNFFQATYPESERPPSFLRIVPKESLQVVERLKGERLPFLIIEDNERTRKILNMWQIPGTLVRVSAQGDIYYPVWRERSWVLDAGLYASCSALPRGWSFERLLASKRRPISEIIFHQVRKDGGAVEAAIRNMDHVIDKYAGNGKELSQIEALRRQIQWVLATSEDEDFDDLYQQTLQLLEESSVGHASLALKRDIERLLVQVSTGRDRLGRHNPLVMTQKLAAAGRRIEYRCNETGFIITKFTAMKAGLMAQREQDRQRLEKAVHEFGPGLASHYFFRQPPELDKKGTQQQQGIIMGKVGTLAYQLEQVQVKPYRPLVNSVIGELEAVRALVKQGDYQQAAQIFLRLNQSVTLVLNQFAEIYPQDQV